ncbi:MAG: hypothetical protein RLZZ450_433, partial [Pseudomonadota bacterium]
MGTRDADARADDARPSRPSSPSDVADSGSAAATPDAATGPTADASAPAACTPKAETCDGQDNDCVKNACNMCGAVPAEVCDGVDNDCDKVVDGPAAAAACARTSAGKPHCDSAAKTCVACQTATQCGTNETCTSGACVAAPRCGDSKVDAGEECDDGNLNSTDDCIACKRARCGDGSVQASKETCDPALLPYTEYTCDRLSCAKRDLYLSCTPSTSGECGGATGSGYCAYGYCSPRCPGNTNAECPK